jgi:hypothetical protein
MCADWIITLKHDRDRGKKTIKYIYFSYQLCSKLLFVRDTISKVMDGNVHDEFTCSTWIVRKVCGRHGLTFESMLQWGCLFKTNNINTLSL